MIIKSCITEYFNSNNKFIYNINKYRIFIIIKLNINNHVEVEFFIKDSNFFRIRYYNNFIECRVIVNNKYYNYNFIGLINFYNKYYNKKKIDKFIQKIPVNKYKVYATYILDDIELPNYDQIVGANSELLK
jgi:hypothetical protein